MILHHYDDTVMEFGVHVRQSIFYMAEDQAIQVMLNVHVLGLGVDGIYTYEIAEMKVSKTISLAQEQEYPLLCTMERV